MPISEIEVRGYRSVRALRLPLARVTVFVGPNGCGKSNLYRALELVSAAARGGLARALLEEGGMPSVMWAGATRPNGPRAVEVRVDVDEIRYELDLGLVPEAPDSPTKFRLDPWVRRETVSVPPTRGTKRVSVLARNNQHVLLRDDQGRREEPSEPLSPSESALSQIAAPGRYPVIAALAQLLGGLRFYHHFRSDARSPLREPRPGVRTPVLASDGSDLAAALQTIAEIGDRDALDESTAHAFGARLSIGGDASAFEIRLHQPSLGRPLTARELSDGTLRYLCLVAALLTPRPPMLLALNEPEASLHPDVLPSLARLIERASHHSQLWISTHSRPLADAISESCGVDPIELELVEGATRWRGRGSLFNLA